MNWDKLTVVVTGGKIPKQTGWNAPPQVFPAETCARHVYLGLRDDFRSLPNSFSEDKQTTIYEGVAAYNFFMQWFVGFKNDRYLSDHNVSGQIRKDWQLYCAKHPDDYRPLQPYIDAIFADGKVLKSSLPSFVWQQPTIASTAVKEAGLNKDSRVLVVCEAEALSKEVIRAMGYRKKNMPAEITLTHPDPKALTEIIRVINAQEGHKAISVGLRSLSFPLAMRIFDSDRTNIFNADAVFVCVPMETEKFAPVDREIREMWQLRGMSGDPNGRLFHVKGAPLQRGKTSQEWEAAREEFDFTDYVTLMERNLQRIRASQEAIEKARGAIEQMAALRGEQRRAIKVSFDKANKSPEIVASRRPHKAYLTMDSQTVGHGD